MKNSVPHTTEGTRKAETSIWRIQRLPPIRAYRLPPKYPLIGDVAAYTNIAVLTKEPRLVGKRFSNLVYQSRSQCEFGRRYLLSI